VKVKRLTTPCALPLRRELRTSQANLKVHQWRRGRKRSDFHSAEYSGRKTRGAVARFIGIEGGVVSGVFNLEFDRLEASEWTTP
jgi:hypothetical protein